MITEDVIKEIYKKYRKPPKEVSELDLDNYLDLLSATHNIKKEGIEIVLEDLEPMNPFRMFLIRNIHAILDFDKVVAFVFPNHILFLGKEDNSLRVHIKQEEKKSLFGRLFGGS